MAEERRFSRRQVRSDDPSLSPEAKRLLTEELREEAGAASGKAGGPLRRAGDEAVAERARWASITAVVVVGVLVLSAAMGFIAGPW